MASNEKYTILYGRLSQEDTQKTNKTDDSNSIQNQELICKGWFLPPNTYECFLLGIHTVRKVCGGYQPATAGF